MATYQECIFIKNINIKYQLKNEFPQNFEFNLELILTFYLNNHFLKSWTYSKTFGPDYEPLHPFGQSPDLSPFF